MSHRQAIGLGRTFADMERIVMSQPFLAVVPTPVAGPAVNPKECADHIYLEFVSRELEGPVRVGIEYLEEVSYQFGKMPETVELRDVWIGGMDLSMHLSDCAMKALQYECEAAWEARGARS